MNKNKIFIMTISFPNFNHKRLTESMTGYPSSSKHTAKMILLKQNLVRYRSENNFVELSK